MAKTRTFIAVEIAAEVRRAAEDAIAALRPVAGGYQWVSAENMHYTLQFLGDLTDQDVADVCMRVQQACGELSPFALESRGLSAFPALDRPRTVWAGVGHGTEEIVSVQAAIEAKLEGSGFRAERRRYTPHMTLGKAPRTGRHAEDLVAVLNEMDDYALGETAVSHVTVFASELLRSGPEYHVLATCELGG